MNLFVLFASLLFIFGYVLIALESKINTSKSAISLALGGILWLITAVTLGDGKVLQTAIEATGNEIFSIAIFLLSAMALIEILVHYRFFDLIRLKLAKYNLDDRGQFWVIAIITFFLSAMLDNLTVTIVMIQIARRFFKDKGLLIAAAGIVIAANAGGAWSPIGDVTTIMIWLAKRFSASEIIMHTFLPSAVLTLVSTKLLAKQITTDTKDKVEDEKISLTLGEKIIIGACLGSFSLPLMMSLIGLPPYMGLLLGLGVTWILVEFFKQRTNHKTHLEANIEHLLQKTDIASIKFFIGILLAVSALDTIGILQTVSTWIFGQTQFFARVAFGNVFIGLLSAIVDNVPLTALSLDLIKLHDPTIWTQLALAVGTGGSFLIIGSAAGVMAMGMVKELTFEKYWKIASMPALIGYLAAMAVWFLQYRLFL